MKGRMDEVDPKTLNAAYDLSMQALDSSSREASSVEGKLIGAFAVSTIIVGLLPLAPGGPDLAYRFWPGLFLYFALAAYVWIAFWIYWGFRARELYSLDSFDPTVLRQHYWQLEEVAFKTAIYSEVENALASNRKHLYSKRYALTLAVPGMVVEIASLIVWGVARTGGAISS